MNRRNFFKTTALGIGAIVLTPTITLGATTELPLYKQFDWLPGPVSLLHRINEYECGHKELESIAVAAKTYKFKLTSDVNVDYTQEYFVGNNDKGISDLKYNQRYYTNALLLNEAKKFGFTHIYCFVRTPPIVYPDGKEFVGYCVRGVKMPEWKSVDCKIPGIKINRNKQCLKFTNI